MVGDDGRVCKYHIEHSSLSNGSELSMVIWGSGTCDFEA